MDELELLVDLHVRNERQGPGRTDDTRRALALTGIRPDAHLSIADVGCGTGASALVLAQDSGAPVRAFVMLPAFVERARARAEDEKEQRLYAERGEWFSYGFFVARRFDGD